MKLSAAESEAFQSDGFVIRSGFADQATLDAMHTRAVDLANRHENGESIQDALIQPESALQREGRPLSERTSKIFRVHRHEDVFRAFAEDTSTTDPVASLIGDDLDCFLSQFIFKQPGALGQPWHQDAFYFPFDGPGQIGLWLAITESRIDNGPLWVIPGSHIEPVHAAVKDQRPHANHGYYEIVDHDMSSAVPVLMEPGDLLIFHAHLMHKSTDNDSSDLRAAMVYHYATADTVDNSEAVYGRKPANQDWLPVLRNGEMPR